MTTAIDLNADLGEDCGDDAAMLDVITTANVSCGLHAGNPMIMVRTMHLATQKGVMVGAHPSYPDRDNFGRVSMMGQLSPDDLKAVLRYQLSAFSGGAYRIRHVKAHGALYNDAMVHDQVAKAIVRSCSRWGAAVMGLAGSALEDAANSGGLNFIAEFFADRAYLPDGTLVPRSVPGAVLHDADVIAARVVRMATTGLVTTIDGSDLAVKAASVCVHGDTPGAVAIAVSVRNALSVAGVTVKRWQ